MLFTSITGLESDVLLPQNKHTVFPGVSFVITFLLREPLIKKMLHIFRVIK